MRHKRSRFAKCWLVVSMVMLSGCGKIADIVILEEPAPRVSVKGYPLDVAFGEAPPQEEVSSSVPLRTIARELFAEFFEEELPTPTKRPSTKPIDPCPPPGPEAVAIEPITVDVKKAPAKGAYLWKQEGTVDFAGLVKTNVKGLTSRIVRNVTGTGAGSTSPWTFDYDTTVGGQGLRQVWSMRVVAGDGIFITRIVRKSSSGDRTFSPVTPVEIFALPASENVAVAGAGADPVNGEALVVQATILRKERVEGCNEVVDGWFVKGTWTFRTATTAIVYDIEYVIATQHGGLLIEDKTKFSEMQGPLTVTHDIKSTIGSIEPRPEP